MNVTIGTTNNTKINAVKAVFPEKEVMGIKVSSGVAAQPFSDEETRQGAINRAKNCVEQYPSTMGVGLEGGVMFVGDQLFLCNWGALVTAGNASYTASGARILLPREIADQLHHGAELGDVMDRYAKKKEVRHNEGAIGIFTKDRVSRQSMFEHVVLLLKGQMEYWEGR
jgi:inosine/xanthosine triphosphatase